MALGKIWSPLRGLTALKFTNSVLTVRKIDLMLKHSFLTFLTRKYDKTIIFKRISQLSELAEKLKTGLFSAESGLKSWKSNPRSGMAKLFFRQKMSAKIAKKLTSLNKILCSYDVKFSSEQ